MMGRWLDPLPPLAPDAYLRRPIEDLPFPLGESGARLFKIARHALWQGVRALGLRRGDVVLVPAYHHGSEVEALVRSGLECRFYGADELLQPTEDELEPLLDERVRALQLIHYLGFPQDSARWRRWCDERGLLLLEDAAQAWLSSRDGHPVGSLGDLAIFSLYKTVGLPHGGALACRAAVGEARARRGRGLAGLAERHRLWIAQRSPVGRRAAPAPPQTYDPEHDFALGDPASPPSAAVRFLLPRLADAGVAGRRAAAYRLLLEALGDRVPEPFAELPPGASPFLFPIEADDKRGMIERLAREGVGAVDLWSAPHPALPAAGFPGAQRRRARTVGLPVHQGLGPEDLERVAAAVALRRTRPQQPPLETVADLESVRGEWSALAERSGNVFASWEWCSAWRRHLGVDHDLLVTAWRRADGSLAGLIPLCRSSFRRLPALRFLGHGDADQLGPICDPEDRPTAARALRLALRAAPGRSELFLAEGLPGDEGWSTLLGATVLERSASPVLELAATEWSEFLAGRSRHLRKRIGYLERSLARRHEVAYRLADAATLERDLDTLFTLHGARWGAGSRVFAGPRRAFHRDWAAQALARGWLRLWLLELDGRPAAAWYGFRFGGSEWHYQGGRDPRLERDSVGFVLMCHTIREAINDGMRAYKFLLGGEAYKSRFASRDAKLETLAVATGAVGHAALAAATARRAARSLPPAMRELRGRGQQGPAGPTR